MKITIQIRNIALVILVTMGILTSTLFADTRSQNELNNVAINLAKIVQPSTAFTIHTQVNQQAYALAKDKAYKVIYLKPKGWVIVSKDDSYRPIIGYNLDADFISDAHAMPTAFVSWMQNMNDDMQVAKEQHIQDKHVLSQWEYFAEEPEAFVEVLYHNPAFMETSQKGPLLGKSIQWDQNAPYWDLNPVDNGRHTYVGCVATAMAQIMAYHKWPDRGVGSYEYTHKKYDRLSVDLNTKYNWTAMTNADKAKISYHIGVVSEMDYGVTVSLAWPQTRRWTKYFKYDMSRWTQMVNVSKNVWESRIKSNIDNNLPLYYSGRSEEGTHAFVLEGYRFSNNTKVYYFNWGWGGEKNGWFTLGGDFTTYQSAIFDIQPHKGGESKPKAVSNLKVTRIQKSSATLTWTDNATNEKGFKIYKGTTLVKTVVANVRSYTLTGLQPNLRYTYSVKAYNDAGESSAVSVHFTTQSATTPIHTISLNQTLSGKWTSAINSKHRRGTYAHYYTFTLTSSKFVVIDLKSSEDTYMFLLSWKGREGKVLEANDDYSGINSQISKVLVAGDYTIEATTFDPQSIGNFTLSLKESAKPKAVSNLKATNIQKTTATLTWRDNTNNEKGFKVYQGSTLVKILGANVTNYTLTGLSVNTRYTYSVLAYNDAGLSASVHTSFSSK